MQMVKNIRIVLQIINIIEFGLKTLKHIMVIQQQCYVPQAVLPGSYVDSSTSNILASSH